jgi:hypothetical protein
MRVASVWCVEAAAAAELSCETVRGERIDTQAWVNCQRTGFGSIEHICGSQWCGAADGGGAGDRTNQGLAEAIVRKRNVIIQVLRVQRASRGQRESIATVGGTRSGLAGFVVGERVFGQQASGWDDGDRGPNAQSNAGDVRGI